MSTQQNTILVTIDTLRKDMVGLYNPRSSLTPFMDSLKETATLYLDPYSTGPYTQASFQGILASAYYLNYGKEKKLNPQKVLLSEVLQKNGIYTVAFHSNAYLSYYFGYNRGWDTFYDSMADEVSDLYPFIRGKAINQKVETFLKDFSFKKPLFLWVHYMDVHEPYIAEKKYLAPIDSGLNLKKEQMFRLFRDTLLKRDVSQPQKVDTLKKLYMSKVAETDEHLKKLFSLFEAHKLLENSTIFITSDHGDEFCEHGGLSHDGKMYNELVSVPFLIYDRKRGARTIEEPVSLIDIPPTIAEAMDIPPSPAFEGRSLLSNGPGPILGEAMDKIGHKEKDTDQPIHYLAEDGLKLIHSQKKGWEAYDQTKDKEEENNIIEEVSNNLKDKLSKFINRGRKE